MSQLSFANAARSVDPVEQEAAAAAIRAELAGDGSERGHQLNLPTRRSITVERQRDAGPDRWWTR